MQVLCQKTTKGAGISQTAIRRVKLKLCIHAYDISLYKVCVFLLSLSHYFGCYGNLKFPLSYKTKSGKLQFFENYCSMRPEKW